MSVFNGERYLREAIDSILKQTYANFEFLIINDCSTDSSLDIIKSYSDKRILLIDNRENLGLTKSLNKGLAIANGGYIARMDADDISNEHRFERQMNHFEKHQDLVILGTQARIINEHSQLLKGPAFNKLPLSCEAVRFYCMINNPFVHSSIMMRKDIILDKYGGYDTTFRTSQDYDLWTRVVYENRSENLDECLLDLRIHSNSISANYSKKSMNSLASMYKYSIKSGVGLEISEKWVDQWILKNNPTWNSDKLSLGFITQKIEELHSRFLIFNNIPDNNRELLYNKYLLLVRVAYNSASVDRKISLILFTKTLLKETRLCLSILPMYILKFIFGASLRLKVNQLKSLLRFRS